MKGETLFLEKFMETYIENDLIFMKNALFLVKSIKSYEKIPNIKSKIQEIINKISDFEEILLFLEISLLLENSYDDTENFWISSIPSVINLYFSKFTLKNTEKHNPKGYYICFQKEKQPFDPFICQVIYFFSFFIIII